MGKALIIVDVQPTFCEGGELGVEGGNAVAERIAKYVESHRGEYAYIATTQDWKSRTISRRGSIRRHTPVSKDRKTIPTVFPRVRKSMRIWRRARRLPMRYGRLASRAWTSSDWRNRIA